MIQFTFLEVPRPKPRARVTARGSYTPSEYKAYEDRIKYLASEAMRAHGVATLLGPLRIDYTFYLAANRGDLDNYVKGVQDAMNKVVFKDDRQVQVTFAVKIHRKANPAIRVTVTELPDDWAAEYQER